MADRLSSSIASATKNIQSTIQGAVNQGTTVSPMGAYEIDQAKNRAAPDAFQLNPLSKYHQPAYHFRFFMTSDTASLKGATVASADDMSKTLFAGPYVMLAESGVTSGFNIKEVTIDNIVGPNPQSRNMNVMQMKIVIIEPYGTSFLDKIVEAARQLPMRNYTKGFYYLQLTFRGYDEQGNVISNLLAGEGFDNGGVWLWQINVKDMEVQFDNSGSVYTLTCLITADQVVEDQMWQLPEAINPEADTVGNMFKELEEQLNQITRLRYGDYPLIAYHFELHPIANTLGIEPDPNKWQLQYEAELNNQRANGFTGKEDKKVKAHFNRGFSLHDIVDYVYAHTQEGQSLAKGLKRTNEVNVSDKQGTTKRFRECIVLKVEADAEILEFDEVTNLYQRKVTIHVFGYSSQRPIISSLQVEDAKAPEAQKAMLQQLQDAGFLRKRYEYLFTGLNTEVIKVDLHYNLTWSAALPRFEGFIVGVDTNAVQEKFNEQAKRQNTLSVLSKNLNRLRDLQDQIEANQKNIKNLDAQALQAIAEPIDIDAVQKSRDKLVFEDQNLRQNAEQARYASVQASSLLQQARNVVRIKAAEAAKTNAAPRDPNARFAEDLSPRLGTAPDDNLAMMVSTYQDPTDAGLNQLRGAFAKTWQIDMNVFGTVLDQLYGVWAKQFLRINMEIRGDPYWIGPSNMDRRKQYPVLAAASGKSDFTNLPSYRRGDETFILRFRYPTTIDATGTPQFGAASNTFNGVYSVQRVTHTFSDGMFKQTLDCIRLPLLNLVSALGGQIGEPDVSPRLHESFGGA